MKTLETFYFPDTAILTERQFPLFLLFGKVHILAPVEDHFPSTTKKLDTFMDSRFCQVHTPHPLGEDRQRFLYLINDIQNRKDDYAAQLSNITLASMSDKKSTGDEAKYQIVSSLLGRHSAEKKDRNEQQKDLLWQARLVLKIGEMLDQEEEEVARSLVHLDENEADLFERLKGENAEDDDIAELYSDLDRIKTKLDKPRTEAVGKRLRAWFRLADGADLPACPVWSTTRQEVFDILATNHEKKHQHEPELISVLQLPTILDLRKLDIHTAIDEFHETTQKQLQHIVHMVLNTLSDDAEDTLLQQNLADWNAQLDKQYPKEQFGRTTVTFYRFENPLAQYSGITPTVENLSASKFLALFSN